MVTIVRLEPGTDNLFALPFVSDPMVTFAVTGARNASKAMREMGITVIVDCNECAVRDLACRDCVVTVLLGEPSVRDRSAADVGPPERVTRIDQDEQAALAVLADGGLVPALRLVRTGPKDGFRKVTPTRHSCEPRRIG